MQKEAWLPENYEVPKSESNYYKFGQGANKFRIMSQPIMGWMYWTDDNKPKRLKAQPTETPDDLRSDDKIKHFWAFIVWNYKAKKLQILELTQASIMGPIQDLVLNEDWGPPQDYDITVSKKGEKLDTEYSVAPSPHKDVPPEALNARRTVKIELEALFDGSDPFEGSEREIEKADTPF